MKTGAGQVCLVIILYNVNEFKLVSMQVLEVQTPMKYYASTCSLISETEKVESRVYDIISVENQLASDAARRLRMCDERYTQDGFWDAVHVDEVIINVDVCRVY